MKARKLCVPALACLVAACAGTPRSAPPLPPDDRAMLAPDLSCAVPAPGPMLEPASADQAITAHFRDRSFSFEAQIQSSPSGIDLVAIDALGRRGLTAGWHNGRLEATRASWLPPIVRAADIVTDIAIVYWPLEAIAPALAACGAVVKDQDGVRTISANGPDLLTITYGPGQGWSRPAHLQSHAFGLSIDIQSIEQ